MMMRFAKHLWPLLVLGLTMSLVACGQRACLPAVYPVTGKVLFRGQPAEGALVTFVPLKSTDPQPRRPGATVRDDGSFRLSTYVSYDGAPAGEYAVTIIYRSPERKVDDENRGPDLLRGHYADPTATPLKVEVKKEANVLEPFNLP